MRRALAALPLLVLACDEPLAGVECARVASAAPASTLPVHGNAVCDGEPPAPPSVCEWVGGVAGIAWGRLVALRAIVSPALEMVNGGRLVERCDGGVDPGVVLEIEVDCAAAGSARGLLELLVGAEQVQRWSPAFILRDGALALLPGDATSLRVGDRIGAGYRTDPASGVATLMGEALFTITDAGDGERVVFQAVSSDSCDARPPAALDGVPLATFAEAVRACAPSPAGDARRRLMESTWGQSPVGTRAAKCFPRG